MIELRKYKNRKLYYPEISGYVDHEVIYNWLKAGAELRVIDNVTKLPCTENVLLQVLTRYSKLNVSELCSLITKGYSK